MNKIIPHRSPNVTTLVWRPCIVPSRVMSRHHWMQVSIKIVNPIKKRFMLNSWNHFTIPVVIISAAEAPVKGHGL
jgi:hypothetical protein